MTVHQGAKFGYEELRWPGANGREVRRQFIRHPGSVVVVPLFGAGESIGGVPGPGVVLIRSLRQVLGGWILEFPAGTRDRAEDPGTCARRELIEETGLVPATLTPLGRFYTGPGMTDEFMHAFAASGLAPGPTNLEADEAITIHPVSVSRLWSLIDSGELADSKSIAASLLALRAGLIFASA